MFFDGLEDALTEGIHGFTVGVDVEVELGLPAAPASLADVFHGRVNQVGVGHRDDGVGRGANQGGSQVDFDDFALGRSDDDPVADLERTVEQHRDGTEEVGDGVLGSQRKRQAGDAQPGDERGQVKAHGVGHEHGADENDGKAQNALQGRNERLFRPVQLVVGVEQHDHVVNDVDEAEGPDHHGDGHHELKDARQETDGEVRHEDGRPCSFHVVDHDAYEDVGQAHTNGGTQSLVRFLNGLAFDGL